MNQPLVDGADTWGWSGSSPSLLYPWPLISGLPGKLLGSLGAHCRGHALAFLSRSCLGFYGWWWRILIWVGFVQWRIRSCLRESYWNKFSFFNVQVSLIAGKWTETGSSCRLSAYPQLLGDTNTTSHFLVMLVSSMMWCVAISPSKSMCLQTGF